MPEAPPPHAPPGTPTAPDAMGRPAHPDTIRRLRRDRPRSRFLRWSSALLFLVVALSWIAGDLGLGGIPLERRLGNVQRFLGEITPYPVVRGEGWSAVGPWIGELMQSRGWTALANTLALSVASIVLAAGAAGLFSALAARNVSTPAPFGVPDRPGPDNGTHALAWRTLALLARGILVFVRSIPEYIWAYLLLAFLGPQAWPLVLALALHNFGLLGRLGAEAIENVPRPLPASRRSAGLSRSQILSTQLLPSLLPRLLVFFSYRWETCLRDATVLGMLGFASLGFFIVDARARQHYDEMMLFVVLSVVLILAGDALSWFIRRLLRVAH